MNVYIWKEKLPSAYQEVEWIGNSGTQYIDTGVRVPNHKVIANIEYTNFGTWMTLGAYLGPDGGIPGGHARLYGGYGNDDKYWSYGFLNDYGNYGGSVSLNTKYKLEVSTISGNMYFEHDGTTYGNSSSTYSTSLAGNFGILGSNFTQSWEAWNSAKVYDYKIYDNTNTLIRDFVPCYRKSDNVIGMYDIVNNQFYTNSGTGTFSKGNDVTMTLLKNDYIGEYKGFEYSYDFRNKSVSQLQSDGYSFTNTEVVSFDGNGIRMSSWDYAGVAIESMSSFNKINIAWTLIVSSSEHDATVGISSSKDTTVLSNFTGFYSYASGIHCIRGGSETVNSASVLGTYSCSIDIDLINKTSVFKFGGNTYNYTLTDSEIANIRQDCYFSMLLAKNTVYVKDISITAK